MEPDGAEGFSSPKALKSYLDFSSVQVEAVGLGKSAAFGSLAVPERWPASLPAPADSVDDPASPADAAPGLTFGVGLMGMVTGLTARPDHETPAGAGGE
jgi:hypothetical protein